jgi:hypothetical protein
MTISQTFSSSLTGGGNNSKFFGTPVNNAILDPMQGFDADVWVLDQGTGAYNLVGRFTSIQLTVRNATEPYLELNQRMPRLLDGEFQIGWVLERGMLDTRVLEQTFGYAAITRELRNNRNVRFQISFSVNAPELQSNSGGNADSVSNRAGLRSQNAVGGFAGLVTSGSGGPEGQNPFQAKRQAIGEYVLTFCKVDSWTMGINAGRNVIANRWEGMCEGIEYVTRENARIPDAGTFLSSISGAEGLRRGALALDSTDPFPWDQVLYQSNSAGLANGFRSNNPLGRMTDNFANVGTNSEFAGNGPVAVQGPDPN